MIHSHTSCTTLHILPECRGLSSRKLPMRKHKHQQTQVLFYQVQTQLTLLLRDWLDIHASRASRSFTLLDLLLCLSLQVLHSDDGLPILSPYTAAALQYVMPSWLLPVCLMTSTHTNFSAAHTNGERDLPPVCS